MPIDFESTQANYRDLQARLDDEVPKLELQSEALVAYGLLCDGLEAAGYARALGKPEEEWLRWLDIAAKAGRLVFSGKGAVMPPEPLPGIEVETFVDTSDTNPWTYVQTIYAALATGQNDIVDLLAGLEAEAWHSAQVQVSPALDRFAFALTRAASGRDQHLDDLRALALAEFSDPDDIYWHLQARVLIALNGERPGEISSALANLSEFLQNEAEKGAGENDPDQCLQLPLLGLTALADRPPR